MGPMLAALTPIAATMIVGVAVMIAVAVFTRAPQARAARIPLLLLAVVAVVWALGVQAWMDDPPRWSRALGTIAFTMGPFGLVVLKLIQLRRGAKAGPDADR